MPGNSNAGGGLLTRSRALLNISAAIQSVDSGQPSCQTGDSRDVGTAGFAAASRRFTISSGATCPKPTTSAPVAPQPAGGQGTLNLADDGPVTLDPGTAAEVSSARYILQIFGGLARLDDNLKVVPDIASSWDLSPDGKTYTFHLRSDARFHDGRQVRAGDFKYSWERALNPATNSLTAGAYLNDIVGSGDILSGKTTQLSGVKVVDDFTLQVTIDGAKAYFMSKMAYPTAFVVDKANVDSGSTWWQRPNGTGPFRLKQWQTGKTLVLEQNPAYYGVKAKLNQVVFQLFNGNPLQLYQEGTIDMAPVDASYMGLVTDPSNAVSRELQEYPELSIQYIGFNSAAPPFDDANVRRAFTYAVDKTKLITLAAKDVVTAAYGVLPPGMPGYNPNFQGLRFDPAKAKQMIAASRYGDVSRLPPIVLTVGGLGNGIDGLMGGVIDDWRRNLGVEVTVRQLETEAYYYALNQEKDNLYENGWIADYPDPQDFLDLLFRTGAQNNTGAYSNPQLDALLDKAATQEDPAARLKMYQDAEQMVAQDAATLPLSFGRGYQLVKPYVIGYKVNPLGIPQLSKVTIQK